MERGELNMGNKDWAAGEMAREKPAGLALSPKRSAEYGCVRPWDVDIHIPKRCAGNQRDGGANECWL